MQAGEPPHGLLSCQRQLIWRQASAERHEHAKLLATREACGNGVAGGCLRICALEDADVDCIQVHAAEADGVPAQSVDDDLRCQAGPTKWGVSLRVVIFGHNMAGVSHMDVMPALQLLNPATDSSRELQTAATHRVPLRPQQCIESPVHSPGHPAQRHWHGGRQRRAPSETPAAGANKCGQGRRRTVGNEDGPTSDQLPEPAARYVSPTRSSIWKPRTTQHAHRIRSFNRDDIPYDSWGPNPCSIGRSPRFNGVTRQVHTSPIVCMWWHPYRGICILQHLHSVWQALVCAQIGASHLLLARCAAPPGARHQVDAHGQCGVIHDALRDAAAACDRHGERHAARLRRGESAAGPLLASCWVPDPALFRWLWAWARAVGGNARRTHVTEDSFLVMSKQGPVSMTVHRSSTRRRTFGSPGARGCAATHSSAPWQPYRGRSRRRRSAAGTKQACRQTRQLVSISATSLVLLQHLLCYQQQSHMLRQSPSGLPKAAGIRAGRQQGVRTPGSCAASSMAATCCGERLGAICLLVHLDFSHCLMQQRAILGVFVEYGPGIQPRHRRAKGHPPAGEWLHCVWPGQKFSSMLLLVPWNVCNKRCGALAQGQYTRPHLLDPSASCMMR